MIQVQLGYWLQIAHEAIAQKHDLLLPATPAMIAMGGPDSSVSSPASSWIPSGVTFTEPPSLEPAVSEGVDEAGEPGGDEGVEDGGGGGSGEDGDEAGGGDEGGGGGLGFGMLIWHRWAVVWQGLDGFGSGETLW